MFINCADRSAHPLFPEYCSDPGAGEQEKCQHRAGTHRCFSDLSEISASCPGGSIQLLRLLIKNERVLKRKDSPFEESGESFSYYDIMISFFLKKREKIHSCFFP